MSSSSSFAELRKAFEAGGGGVGGGGGGSGGLPSPAVRAVKVSSGTQSLGRHSARPLPPSPAHDPPRPRADSLGGAGGPARAGGGMREVQSSREAMLEQKILDLQREQLLLVERLSTYELYAINDESHHALRNSTGAAGAPPGSPAAGGMGSTSFASGAGSGSGSIKLSGGDILNKLRGNLSSKLEKSQKKKEAQQALDSGGDMDVDFWSRKNSKRRIKLDLEKMEILHPLTKEVGGSLARLHVVEVDGLVCVMKELDIAFARELNANLVRTFEAEVQFLENLPVHPNIVRYLFHTFDHEKGRARLFMTQYALSLRDEIVRRKLGIGNVASGMSWCSCCPKCSHVQSGSSKPLGFTLIEAARVLLDIAQGLTFLHSHSVLHRDLSKYPICSSEEEKGRDFFWGRVILTYLENICRV